MNPRICTLILAATFAVIFFTAPHCHASADFPDPAAWTLRWSNPQTTEWYSNPQTSSVWYRFWQLRQRSGQFIAGGIHSSDGLEWNSFTLPADVRFWLNDSGVSDGVFILNGAGNDLWNSTNGTNWTKRANGGGYDDLTGIESGNETIVMNRYWSQGSLLVSKDSGNTWTYVDTGGFNTGPGLDGRHYERTVFGGEKFLFPLFDSVRTSSDGLTWETTVVPNRPPAFRMAYVGHYDTKAQKFIGVQQTGSDSSSKTLTIASSADGINWTFHESQLPTANAAEFWGGGIGPGLIMAVGGTPPEVWASSNEGQSWARINGPWESNGVTGVAFAATESTIVAATPEKIYSADLGQQTKLLVNGSFEQPDVLSDATSSDGAWITYGNGYAVNGPRDGFTGWSVTRGEVDVMNTQRHAVGAAAEGLQFLDLDGRMPGAIAQTIAVVPGKRYTLSFKYGRNSAASMSVQVTGPNSSNLFTKQVAASGTGPYPGPWDVDGGSFVADGEQVTLSFSSDSGDGSADGVKLDDVKVYEDLPPPPDDPDNDGVGNYREDKDGTDPSDPNSFNPLSKGLVGYYPFDGNANDESGYGNHGVVNGAVLSGDRLGRENGAFYFDGSSFITGGNVIPNYKDGATLACWVKSSHVGLQQGAVGKPRPYGDYCGFAIGIEEVSGAARAGLNTGSGPGATGIVANEVVNSDQSISDDRWHHLLAVTDGAKVMFYLDGEFVGQKNVVSDPIMSARLLQIGREGEGGPQYGPKWFFGSVDEVRVYNRALTEGEVQQLYAVETAGLDSDGDGVTDYRERRDGTTPLDSSSFNALSKNLIVHYPFDGNTLDESGYANHAVNRGAAISTDRFGGDSGAYDFNGVDAYMDAPPLISDYQRNFTMSGWIRTTNVSSDRLDAAVSALCKTRDAGDFGGPAIDFREGKAVFTFNNNRVYGYLIPFEEWEYATTDTLADGNWRHYIMSIDADGLITAFINGQQVASHQISTFLEVTGASPFQIGRAGGAHEAGRYFPGQIDEVRIYNRGLTAEEATMLYSESVCGLDSDADGVTDYRERRDGTNPYDVASFEPLSVALIANYPFDNSWKDESGYCRDVLAPYTTFEPGLLGTSLGLAEGNSQASYWNDPNNTESPGRINNFTFSVWMKAATLDQPDGQAYYLVSAPNNAAYLRIANGAEGSRVLGLGYEWPSIPGYGYQTLGTSVLRTGVWQHVVGVQEGEATRIYVNGTLVGSTDTGELVPFDPENFTLGNLFNSNTFQGQLDEVRIYVRALSPAEVGALYVLEIGDLDSDNDGLDDVHETNTGTFVSATDTGSDPYDSDSSDDGLLDGEVVTAGFNPNTSYTPLFNLVKSKSTGDQARIGLFTESAMIDLNLGGIVLRKSGSTVNLRLQIQSKTDLKAPHWTDEGTETFILDMPGNKAFMRIRALGPQ